MLQMCTHLLNIYSAFGPAHHCTAMVSLSLREQFVNKSGPVANGLNGTCTLQPIVGVSEE